MKFALKRKENFVETLNGYSCDEYIDFKEVFMDMIKIGKFLSELRREKNLTQEELGEELGVTNKTVSRWETGTYLPPVEIIQILSQKYGVSINEILSGERISDNEYKEKAEENMKEVLSKSVFPLCEKEEKGKFFLLCGK